MERQISSALTEWKNDANRRPLLVRGARQVGKSFTIQKFCKQHFKNPIFIDFELNPEYKSCFKQKNPQEILKHISILFKKDIDPGQSILFLDEIQQCPAAIESLRYFYERLPALHVIGAGSLLEFALEAQNFRMPVGRVSFMYMYPLSFNEYLTALGEAKSIQMIKECESKQPMPEVIHRHLLGRLKDYMLLGGMPAVLREYITTQKMQKCKDIQSDLLESIRADFGKYATKAKTSYLEQVFNSIPQQVSKRFRYSAINPHVKTASLNNAFKLLAKAGIAYPIRRSSGTGVPLAANAIEKGYKPLFLDVGLMQNLLGLDVEIIQSTDVLTVNAGAIAEQFVGQELLANSYNRKKSSLFYWERAARNSSAEVDYLVEKGPNILPLEVKSGKAGRLKSLKIYMDKYTARKGYKISQENFGVDRNIESIPLYAISTLLDN